MRAVGHEALTVRTVAQRAGVSPATAYTYLASKNHLFAEALLAPPHLRRRCGAGWRQRHHAAAGHHARAHRADRRGAGVWPPPSPPALLGTDPDVARLRLRIGAEFLARFEAAMGEQADPAVLEVLVLTFSGALLQAGMGLMTYDEIAERLVSAVAVILRGH
nr:helix-turn-helix domain-containing protein [Nocardioides convexus]